MQLFVIVTLCIMTCPLLYGGYVFYLLARLDRAEKQARRYSICPVCHRVIRLTHFRCSCGKDHELIPTDKEIFYIKCSCGKRLPKLPRLGRDELVALCPHHRPYHSIGKYVGTFPEVLLPIVGGTSTGKSALLAAWTFYAQKRLPFGYGVDVTFPFEGGTEYADDCLRRFQQGVPPGKTALIDPPAVGLDIVSQTSRKGLRLYLYDPAGEVFDPLSNESENTLNPFGYYDFMDGVLFVIDPFSLPVFQQKYPQEFLNSHGFQASDKRTEDSCEKFIRGLYAHNLGHDEYHYASCAVVITKADAFELDSLVGDGAVQKHMKANPRLSFDDALDEVCSLQLKNWGLGHVVELLSKHFKSVRCFSVSAYGHVPEDGIPFIPQRIELPILWLLNKKMPHVLVKR